LGGGRILGAFFLGSQPSSQSARAVLGPGRLRVECKTAHFHATMPRFSPTMGDNRPVFASQNPRLSDHVMERRGWNSRFPAKFGTGFACRGWLQRRERRARRERQAEGLRQSSLGHRPRWRGSGKEPEPCRGETIRRFCSALSGLGDEKRMMACLFPPTQAVGLGCNVSGLRPDLRPPASGLKPAVSDFGPWTLDFGPIPANRSASRLEDEKEMRIASPDFPFLA